MTDTPSSDHNSPVLLNDDEVMSHPTSSSSPSTGEPDDFLNDAVSGSESTSDAQPASLDHANDAHPELDVDAADITESDGPVVEGGDAGASTPSPDPV